MVLITILFRILLVFLGDPIIIIVGLIAGVTSSSLKRLFLFSIPVVGIAVALILTIYLKDRSINIQIPAGEELFALRFIAFAIYAGIGFVVRRIFDKIRGMSDAG